MPWVSGVIGSTRSSSVMPSRPAKLSNVTCLRRADREASFGIPVVPDVMAISTTRWGSGGAVAGSGPFPGPLSGSLMTSTGRVLSLTHASSCSPSPSGSGSSTPPMSGIASSSATYSQMFGSWTPTTSPALTPRDASTQPRRRTSSCRRSNVIWAPASQTAIASGRRRALASR